MTLLNSLYFTLSMKILYPLVALIILANSITAQTTLPPLFGNNNIQNGFLKNVGQVRDLNNKSVGFVYYQANISGQQVFITNYGLSILLARTKKITRVGGETKNEGTPKYLSPSDSLCIVNYEMERIDIVLKGASIIADNVVADITTQSPRFNFYLDKTQTKPQELQLQDEVLIKNVYPGIDWKVYVKKGANKNVSLKYDFIIHPGADPSRIQLSYSNNVHITSVNNEINASAKMGTLHEEKPFSYLQESNTEVPVVYNVKKNIISFNADKYDKNKTLVIDPSVFWMTYLSSTNHVSAYQSMYGSDVETDAAGNIFVQLSAAGNIPFPTLNPGGGAYYADVTSAPDGAMIIVKFAPGGQMLWSTYFGNGVGGLLMTTDKFGNIITLGMELNGSTTFPNPNPSIPLLNNGGYYDPVRKKYFISKFSNTGVLIWSSYYVNFSSYPTDMTFDINGNIYVTGCSEVHDFPVVNPGGGAYVVTNPQFGYAEVLFISQFNANNQLTWSTRIEGKDYDPYARVCTDKAGNIYIGGQTRSENYPLVNAGGYFNTNSYNSVISRFNPARQMTWSTYFPGAFTVADITTDDSCNLYVAADRRIVKFDSSTHWIYEKTVNTTRMHFWRKINYDRAHGQIQLLGQMNDNENGFPTINTACNGSFFNDGISPNNYNIATGPVFATINHDGAFTYRSLADWQYEYYEYNEMAVDIYGDLIYLFGNQQNGFYSPNPQLTDPGNGAYFDNICCYNGNGNTSALLMKLISSELSVNVQINPPVGCSCDGNANVIPQCGLAPFSYVWNNGATTAAVTGLCPGNYWVKVSDANNLSKTIPVVIPYPPGSITSFTSKIIPENCNKSNGKITVETVQGGTPPYSYSVDGVVYNISPQFTGLASGNYIVRVKDANGCVYNDTFFVSRIQGPASALYNTIESSCIADNGQLQITNVQGGIGPYQYTLSGIGTNATGIFTNLSASNYQLAIVDTAGCSFSKTIEIKKAVAATDANFNTGNDHCNQGIGFINVNNITGGTAPYTFSVDSISFITGTINNLKSNNYPLYVRDANGCVLKKGPIIINNESGPTATIYTKKEAYCGKLTGILEINLVQGGSAPYSYSIDGAGYLSTNVLTGIQSGNHILSVKDAHGCVYSESFEIKYTPIARINLSPIDTTVCYGETVRLLVTGDIDQVQKVNWNIPSQGLSATLKATDEQKIFVSIIDNNNCVIRDTSIIVIKSCNPPEKCIVIPNAFTPNNDGKNEMIGPIANGCIVKDIRFNIYNRWGELVFETKDLGIKWNGRYKGDPQPAGGYIFVCNYTTEDGVKREQKGTFTLIR